MKKDIIGQLSEIANNEDVFQAKRELKHLFDEFGKEKEKAIEVERAEFEKMLSTLSDEEKSDKHFTPAEDPLDEEFETAYREVRIALSEKEKAKIYHRYDTRIILDHF